MDKKGLMILSVIVLVIGAGIFGDQVSAIFHGMTPMESLKFIVTFILHVSVGTIAAYVAYTLPEIVKPWMRVLKRRRKADGRRRKAEGGRMKGTEVQRSRGLTTDALLRAYVMSTMPKANKAPPPPQDEVHIEF